VRLPFVTRARLTREQDRRFDWMVKLNWALAANGDLRRRVASLELENAELRRQLEERR
jgi:hypothetical protein